VETAQPGIWEGIKVSFLSTSVQLALSQTVLCICSLWMHGNVDIFFRVMPYENFYKNCTFFATSLQRFFLWFTFQNCWSLLLIIWRVNYFPISQHLNWNLRQRSLLDIIHVSTYMVAECYMYCWCIRQCFLMENQNSNSARSQFKWIDFLNRTMKGRIV
jgi:hypothetical protein